MDARPFDFVPVASPLHDAAALRRSLEPYLSALAGLGGRETGPEGASGPGPFAIVVGTGGTEATVLRLREARQAVAPDEPLLLVALPAHNSLPAALEALARVRQDGGRGRIVPLRGPDDGPGLARLAAALEDLRVREQLHRARIGLVGVPSDWLVASVPTAAAVRETWGPEVVPAELAPLLEAPLRPPDEAATGLAASFTTGAATVRETDDAGVKTAASVLPALEGLAARERFDAVAVRCFDLVTERGTSGCLAISALNDSGTVAACEGDLASAVAMLWVRELLGTASWMANPSDADAVTGRLRLAHCTVPRSLLSGWDLRSHFESGLGVALAGALPPGPVTLLRLGGRRLESVFLAEGEALPTPRREDLCRTQLDVRLQPDAVAELLERPLGNHLVLVPGHVALRLRAYREWAVGGEDASRAAA